MSASPMLWDIFCRVIDHHGDLGVCWRLARELAARHDHEQDRVRLWVDDPAALAWMAPQGHPGVALMRWGQARASVVPGQVVIEAFGCNPPDDFVTGMAQARPAPLWLNLEYLSAEAYVERSHGLPSPMWSGPGRGLMKWFFYPGFTARTGGLLHGDRARSQAPPLPPRAEWAQQLGLGLPQAALHGAERLVLVFGYASLPWGPWLAMMAALAAVAGPVRLLLPPGPAMQALRAYLAHHTCPPGVNWQTLPLLPQSELDLLLAGCDLNLVRGEDSFVRAQLASDAPFVWQIYPQQDGAHGPKLEAFLHAYLANASPPMAARLARVFRAVNALAPAPVDSLAWIPLWQEIWPSAWSVHQHGWRQQQLSQPDLMTRLREFVALHGPGARSTAQA